MRQFKKRTIALILASTITVAGAFSAENYQNSLMSVRFEKTDNGSVNVLLMTQKNYTSTINPVKKDASTYIIMLPETNCQLDSEPNLTGFVENLNIRTMPYTNTNKGYTKITIKTAPNIALNAKNELYIPSNSTETQKLTDKQHDELHSLRTQSTVGTNTNSFNNTIGQENRPQTETFADNTAINTTLHRNSEASPVEEVNGMEQSNTIASNQSSINSVQKSQDVTYTEKYLIILSLLLISIASIYFYIKGKNKIAEIIGEQSDFDISDDTEEQKQNTKKTMKSTINKIDKKYVLPVKMPISTYNQTVVETVNDELIVDLDELFQEKSKQSTNSQIEENVINIEENKALEDFLNGFSYMEDVPETNNYQYQNELYEKCLNSNNMSFTTEDIKRIQLLLNTEINDDTLKNLDKYAITSPIKKQDVKPKFLLENLVATYSIQQNITFTKEDIAALNKLINVEIDSDFLTDLRINPEKQAIMRAEIEKQRNYPHTKSEVLTLNVKDMLPDLFSALKAQGGKAIKYEVRTNDIYITENTDIQVLSVKNELPDLKKEIHNKDAYKMKPSEEIQVADNSYEVDIISVASNLPDLNDALKHPEKYRETVSKPEVIDEEKLLQSITNVQLKPFSEKDNTEYQGHEYAPTMNEIKEEMGQFGEIEIVNTSDETPSENTINNDEEDFAELMADQYIDLDKSKQNTYHHNTIQPLLKKIEEQKAKRKTKQLIKEETITKSPSTSVSEKKTHPKECTVQNEKFEILSSVNFTDKIGCYLAQNKNELAIIGFTKDKLFKIKSYQQLSNTKIQARINEKFSDGTCQYLVKVGGHKVLLNVHEEGLEFVMELC